MVALGALFALAVVIAVGPDGPARLWLDGGGSTLNLQSRADGQAGAAGGLTLAGSPAGLLTDAPTAGVKGAVTLAATPPTVRLRGATRVQRRSARLPSANRPGQPAPPGRKPTSPTTLVSTPTATAPRRVATPAPGSTVVKTRGRPSTPESKPVAVRKERVSSARPAADPAPASTPAPQVAKAPAQPSTQQQTTVGLDEGVLTRVPPPPTSTGG